MEPVGAALARLSEAQAKCAKELETLSSSHGASPAWASAGIAAVARLCHDPAAAAAAATTLYNLSEADDANDDLIREAGAIPPLVALLSGGPESRAAGTAAAALQNLTLSGEGQAAIAEAGAIPPLVALLSGGPESKAAERAARALHNLALGTNATAVLEEVASTQTDCSSWDRLREKLRECASARLQAAEEGTDVAALERALTLAAAVQVDAAVVEHAQGRLREINGDAERQERRESFGLGSLALPDEFVCPITMDKMQGVPPPALAACIARTPQPRLPRLRRRPGGGVRRPLIRAVRHPLGAPRRQRLEPAHPRAAPAKRAHPEPQPEAAHAGARGGHTARGGHCCGERW